jgi:hypothetical protein
MAQNLPQISFANKNKISGAKMHHKITILGLLLLMVGVAFAQKVYIKIEGMSPHVLEGMGIMNLDSVSSGLPVVGTGTVVWLRGYDVSGDTAFKNATSYEWLFDDIMASYDYDMDGTIEPFMREVNGLVEKLAMALPPRGQPTVDWQLIRTDPDSVRLKQAYWNYRYVTEDKSHGVHNPKYVVALLQLSISKLTGVEFTQPEIPVAFELYQNYPNPFNPSTKIGFALPRESKVKLEVFNVLGERVAVLKDEVMPAGVHVVEFNATGLSSGVYFYRLTAGDFVATKKMVLMK